MGICAPVRRKFDPAETFDGRAQLALLGSSLHEGLPDKTGLTVNFNSTQLTLAYHHIVVLRWRSVGGELVCTPVGWRRKTYSAAGPSQARTITIRLLFEFVRQFVDAGMDGILETPASAKRSETTLVAFEACSTQQDAQS